MNSRLPVVTEIQQMIRKETGQLSLLCSAAYENHRGKRGNQALSLIAIKFGNNTKRCYLSGRFDVPLPLIRHNETKT